MISKVCNYDITYTISYMIIMSCTLNIISDALV